ncbi:hypothetical protein CesoFtcFv8_026969 [Champsocephalus esox]|uniref:Uncharacterized protein n=1 Tax=Champsocephalus esox TaxID=159716 RepID=A0AAN8B060_9TELE|nr:hypothetical protein CesoFtcFv8_026969 [Champsocephalus esox]
MILLYTINNADLLLLHVCYEAASPPPIADEAPGNVPLDHPLIPTANRCRRETLQEIHQGCVGMKRSCPLPPGERGHWSYESQLSYGEKHSGGVL